MCLQKIFSIILIKGKRRVIKHQSNFKKKILPVIQNKKGSVCLESLFKFISLTAMLKSVFITYIIQISLLPTFFLGADILVP